MAVITMRSDKYAAMKDKLRREGMEEEKARHEAMTRLLPDYSTKTMGSWWKEPEQKQGTGGYVYEYNPSDDSYTIVKTKDGKTPTKPVKVTAASNPDAFAAIKQDTEHVADLTAKGRWDTEANAPIVEKQVYGGEPTPAPTYMGKPPAAAKKAPAAAPKKPKPAPAVIKGAAAASAPDIGESMVELDNRFGESEIDMPMRPAAPKAPPSSVLDAFVEQLQTRSPTLRNVQRDTPMYEVLYEVGKALLAPPPASAARTANRSVMQEYGPARTKK